MGTWSIAVTEEDVVKLCDLLGSPFPVGPSRGDHEDNLLGGPPPYNAEDKLYSLLGDDELFDDLYDLRQSHGPEADCRGVVLRHLKRILDPVSTGLPPGDSVSVLWTLCDIISPIWAD